MNRTLEPTESLPRDPAACWEAVLARDARADGTFVYAVGSTGIYCRPSCPSRKPRQEFVRFFASPDAAEAEGYRACLRCRPRDAAPQAEMVRRVCRYIDEHPDDRPDLAALAAEAGLSPSHLQRVFTRLVGVSPRDYAAARRMDRFKAHLREGEAVTDAIYAAGYGSSRGLYEQAPSYMGMTPSTYRKGGAGLTLRYAISDSPLGPMLIAATTKGICAVRMDDSRDEMLESLRREFPGADLRNDPDGLVEWTGVLLRHLSGTQPHLDLPIDVRATAFQRRVWKALQAIPYGSTRSYGAIADEMGDPNAARAVGSACAANPVALVIPCHRAILADGGLGGYRWGVERKRTLLDRERLGSETG